MPDDSLTLALLKSCDLCGREFAPGEEFYRLQRLQRIAGETPAATGGGCEVVSESAFCLRECGGQKVVKI
ncbi:MAG: hypothetical protein C4567_01570 [Deltaproteobacteria bacterium]|nr:MAG: hypothetical protein C4567_01570 [Deltaproteobacteria bacterium]